jgi:16S rRNA (cytidine1402-2'-O)-methyltransferase
VATPIGNLEDITLRALRVLREVDRVACEDTRVTARLFAEYGISTPLMRHEAHNEAASTVGILELLARGESIALVSDAGTPTVRDPGERLVRAAILGGHPVLSIPGPSALLAATSVSGLPAEPLTFHGFVPKKTRERAASLSDLSDGTHAYFCPARDLHDVVSEIGGVHPKAQIAVGRELTKQHETWYRGTSEEILGQLDEHASRGEAVLMLHTGAHREAVTDAEIRAALGPLLEQGAHSKRAAEEVASALGVSKRRVYQLALEDR